MNFITAALSAAQESTCQRGRLRCLTPDHQKWVFLSNLRFAAWSSSASSNVTQGYLSTAHSFTLLFPEMQRAVVNLQGVSAALMCKVNPFRLPFPSKRCLGWAGVSPGPWSRRCARRLAGSGGRGWGRSKRLTARSCAERRNRPCGGAAPSRSGGGDQTSGWCQADKQAAVIPAPEKPAPLVQQYLKRRFIWLNNYQWLAPERHDILLRSKHRYVRNSNWITKHWNVGSVVGKIWETA